MTVAQGGDVVFRLGYRHDDSQAAAVYAVNFRAHISQTLLLGPAREIDTDTKFGGAGLATGNVKEIRLPVGPLGVEQVAVEITSDATGSTVLARCNFQLTVVLHPDLDGDGITNDEERFGLRDGTGNLVLRADGTPAADFPALGANPCRKDIFVEVDYMTASGHNHRPAQAAIDEVVRAFDVAPIPPLQGACPFAGYSAAPGARLHIVADGTLQEPTTTDANGNTVPAGWGCGNLDGFDPARRPYFLYAMFVHTSDGGSMSGLGPCPGRSFVVSLGFWSPAPNGSVRAQSGTFMHELGHVFALGHGGDPHEARYVPSGVNLKPNYLSVMNYSFQFGVPDPQGGRSDIDYSRAALPTLFEATLDERVGIGGPTGLGTVWWGPQPAFRYPVRSSLVRPSNGALDWDQDGNDQEASVGIDVNSDGACVSPGSNQVRNTNPAADDVIVGNEIWNGANRICDSRPPAGDDVQAGWAVLTCVTPGPDSTLDSTAAGDDVTQGGSDPSIKMGPNLVCDTSAAGDDVQLVPVGRSEPALRGFDDWANLNFRIGPFGTSPGAPAPPAAHAHMTLSEAVVISNVLEPVLVVDKIGPKAAAAGDTLTYTVRVANVGAGPATSVVLTDTLPDGTQQVFNLGDISAGSEVTRTLTFTVPGSAKSGSILTNHAAVEYQDVILENVKETSDSFDTLVVLEVKKTPPLQNLWLCNAPGSACVDRVTNINQATFDVQLNGVVDDLDPKCTGFPNFADPATCDTVTIGSFEFEVRYDAKFVNVSVSAGSIWGTGTILEGCESIQGEGFVQFRCNTKGKDSNITGPGTLAVVHVTPTADVYSILVANQLNGIATQLINQDCQLSDLQGHPIAVDVCDNAAVTIRYLEGDVHADCRIDVQDQQQIAFRWGSRLGQLLYNSRYDLEPSYPKKGDSDIDAKDLQLVYGRYQSTCFEPHPAQDPVDPKSKEGEPPPPPP